jgi:23S rRNA (uracil1939-C5)-methyltransferase
MRRRDILRVTIEDLAYGGKGVAKYEGKVIFVEGALPGDTVDACLTKIRGSYCESYAKELITPSPQRIKPLCEHFGTCGGCKWQNYEYPSQLKYKEEQLRRQLIHLGGIAEPPTEPIIGAKKLFYYRNKMEYSFGISESGELTLGLHHAGSYDKIFDMRKCHLQSETANDIVNFVQDECRRLNLPSYNMITHEGLMRFLVVRDGKHTGEYMVNILTGPDYQPHKQGIMELGMNLARKFESIKSLYWTVNSQKSNMPDGIRTHPKPAMAFYLEMTIFMNSSGIADIGYRPIVFSRPTHIRPKCCTIRLLIFPASRRRIKCSTFTAALARLRFMWLILSGVSLAWNLFRALLKTPF